MIPCISVHLNRVSGISSAFLACRGGGGSFLHRDNRSALCSAAATNIAELRAVAIPLALAGAAAIVYGVAFSLFALRKKSGAMDERGQAFSPWTALAFAALLSVILLASQAMNEWFGGSGISAIAAVAGLESVDPAAISAAALVSARKIAATDAVLPILLAFSTNDHQGRLVSQHRKPPICPVCNPRFDPGGARRLGGVVAELRTTLVPEGA